MNILIIKLAAIGDVVRTTTILPQLKKKYPDSKITWVTRKSAYDLLKLNPLINQIVFFRNKNMLLENKYDLVISLDDDEEACRFVSDLDKKSLIGAYYDDNKCRYTDNAARWFDMGLISKYGKERADRLKTKNKVTLQHHLLDMLGLEPPVSRPIIKIPADAMNKAYDFAHMHHIDHKNYVIGINTGAGKRWPQKSWGVKQTSELINRLTDEGFKVILFGGPEEKSRNEQIKKRTSDLLIDSGTDNSLLEFAALINICDLIVTSDSLAMHLATACSKKVVALFGPTSHTEIELYGNGKKIYPDMNCLTCYKKHECEIKPNCMDNITVDEVYDAAFKLINGNK